MVSGIHSRSAGPRRALSGSGGPAVRDLIGHYEPVVRKHPKDFLLPRSTNACPPDGEQQLLPSNPPCSLVHRYDVRTDDGAGFYSSSLVPEPTTSWVVPCTLSLTSPLLRSIGGLDAGKPVASPTLRMNEYGRYRANPGGIGRCGRTRSAPKPSSVALNRARCTSGGRSSSGRRGSLKPQGGESPDVAAGRLAGHLRRLPIELSRGPGSWKTVVLPNRAVSPTTWNSPKSTWPRSARPSPWLIRYALFSLFRDPHSASHPYSQYNPFAQAIINRVNNPHPLPTT